jgi:hypothetical protein
MRRRTLFYCVVPDFILTRGIKHYGFTNIVRQCFGRNAYEYNRGP